MKLHNCQHAPPVSKLQEFKSAVYAISGTFAYFSALGRAGGPRPVRREARSNTYMAAMHPNPMTTR